MVIIIASQSISRAVSYNDFAILSRNVSVTMSTVSVCFKPRYVCKMVHELWYPLIMPTSFGVLEVLHPYIIILFRLEKRDQANVNCSRAPYIYVSYTYLTLPTIYSV